MAFRCGTFLISPVFSDEDEEVPTAWMCVADYVDRDNNACRVFGVSTSSHGARVDVKEQLRSMTEGPIALDEAFDQSERRDLLWSIKQRVLVTAGVPVREVDSSMSAAVEG
jgi:hypothetical protein